MLHHLLVILNSRDLSTKTCTDIVLELACRDAVLEEFIELLKRAALCLWQQQVYECHGGDGEGTVDEGYTPTDACLDVWIDKVDGDGGDEAAEGGEK